MSIRAVILDFGGVLYFTPSLAWVRRWQAIIGLKDDPFITAILSSPEESQYVTDMMVGNIPESQVWESISQRWRISPEWINRARRRAFSPRRWNKELAQFIEGLRPRYKTAILSNAGTDGRVAFSEAFKIEQLVDYVIISAEERVAKPDPKIYQITAERMEIEPQEAVFVDDTLSNVEAARQFGMRAVHFVNTAQTIAEVQGYLD